MKHTKITLYKGFYIVTSKRKTVDLVRPVDGFKVVKSEQAAKWRITRALSIARMSTNLI